MRCAAGPAVSSAALALAASASGALFVTFEPAEADVGDTVTIRLGDTPPDLTAADRRRAGGTPWLRWRVLARAATGGVVGLTVLANRKARTA